MPRWDRARSRNWRRTGTSCCLALSNCVPGVRTRTRHTKSPRAPPKPTYPDRRLQMNAQIIPLTQEPQTAPLTETLRAKLANPEQSSNFDLYSSVNDVLKDVG